MYGLEVLQKDYDLQSPEGKTAFYNEIAQRLIGFEEELERNNYIEAVATEYRIDPSSLRKLVSNTAIKKGLVKPVEKIRGNQGRNKVKEDGTVKSQKILLTWLIGGKNIFTQVKNYVQPEDFTIPLYQTVAELLYKQYENDSANPAQIINYFTKEEEHREVAELFHEQIRELSTSEEKAKALKETIIKVKRNSVEKQSMNLDPMDIVGLQKVMENKQKLQGLEQLHISID